MRELSLAGFGGRVELDFALAPMTTYRLGGPASVYVEPGGAEDLDVLAGVLADDPRRVLVLGRGSNVVVSDAGFVGVVVHLSEAFSWIRAVDDRVVRVGAATPLPQVSNWTARRGRAGMEHLVGIPGAVGGGVRMNAGAHGVEMVDRLVWVSVFDLSRGTLEKRSQADLELSYRYSNLADHDIVVDAEFELPTDDPAAIAQRVDSYRQHRAATQPGAAQNAGSVFRNPPGDHAGRLVEAAGLKGFSVGGASVSELHANFFMAGRGASAQDVYDLVYAVQRRVKDAYGVVLEPEIRFVGPFSTTEAA